MLTSFEFSVNILILMVLAGVSAFIGYRFKKGLEAKKQVKINKLEKEMLQNHAEILQLQKEYCDLEQKLKDMIKPVIPMKIQAKDEEQRDDQREASGVMKKLPTRSA